MLHTAAGFKNLYLRFLLRASHISSQREAVAAAQTNAARHRTPINLTHYGCLMLTAFEPNTD